MEKEFTEDNYLDVLELINTDNLKNLTLDDVLKTLKDKRNKYLEDAEFLKGKDVPEAYLHYKSSASAMENAILILLVFIKSQKS